MKLLSHERIMQTGLTEFLSEWNVLYIVPNIDQMTVT